MSLPLDAIRGASIPVSAVETLADLRSARELFVLLAGQRAWLRWTTVDDTLVLRLMALPDVALYDLRAGLWYPHGRRLPAFDVPLASDGFVEIHRAVVPLPIKPRTPAQSPLAPVTLALVPSAEFRPATALQCGLRTLIRWSDSVSSQRLAGLAGVFAGRTILVIGRDVPAILSGRRYWGSRVLIPLGFRADPALPESVICAALGVTGDDLLILEDDSYDVVPATAIVPHLTRANLRLARERASR